MTPSDWGLIILYLLGLNQAAEFWTSGIDWDAPDAPRKSTVCAVILFWPLAELYDLTINRLLPDIQKEEK